MWPPRESGRRGNRRAFQPSLNGQLESRCLLSTGKVHIQVANHGKISEVFNQQGEKFDIILTGPGIVFAKPMSGGRFRIVVNGTDQASTLEIDPTTRSKDKGQAHVFPGFPTPTSQQTAILNVGRMDVNSGNIFQILAYKTANLSGPLKIAGPSTVDRIAFNALLPGATIQVGSPPPSLGVSGQGDINTLDVFTNATLVGGPGIVVGRDLNDFTVGGTLDLQGGASVLVGRYIGLTPQPVKGSDFGGAGGFIQGDLIIGPGSVIAPGAALLNNFLVQGFASADTISRFIIPPGSPGTLNVLGNSI
jgi:hypothetical protein